MIDKLDLRVSIETELAPKTEELLRTPGSRLRRAAGHYTGSIDLRDIGVNALLHIHSRYGSKGRHHKLEMIGVGRSGYSEILEQIGEVFQCEPGKLKIMRIDLAVDIQGTSLEWCHKHLRVPWKRRGEEIGKSRAVIANGDLETLYFGARNDRILVYNKTAEIDARDVCSRDESLQEYQSQKRDALTRFERQISGSRIPHIFATLNQLRDLPDFNPFSQVQICGSSTCLPRLTSDVMLSLARIGYRELIKELGLQTAGQRIRQSAGSNTKRVLNKLEVDMNSEFQIEILCPEQLAAKFRESVTRQLAA